MSEDDSPPKWPMAESLKAKVLDRLEDVVADPAASHRTIIMVGKLVVSLRRLELPRARPRSKPPAKHQEQAS